MYDAVIQPVNNAVFSMLAFFIVSASCRAFRLRSIQATVLLIVGVITLIGNAPSAGVSSDRTYPSLDSRTMSHSDRQMPSSTVPAFFLIEMESTFWRTASLRFTVYCSTVRARKTSYRPPPAPVGEETESRA